MAEYIEREATLREMGEEPLIWFGDKEDVQANDDWHNYTMIVKNMPAADVVSRTAFEQVMWERDQALSQLEEHGLTLGCKADVVEVVRCGECIHNYGIKANCEFNPHDIVCDYWSTDGMDEKDFCSKGSREDVGYEFVDKTKETCSCGEEVEIQIRSNGEYVFSQAYCHSCGLASAWWDEKTEDDIGRARKSYRKFLEERAAKMAQNIR